LLALGWGTHLFVKVPRPGDSGRTFLVFESSCHLLLYQSKVQLIPLRALPKEITCELAGLSSHYPFFMLNIKQGKLWISTFKVFWS